MTLTDSLALRVGDYVLHAAARSMRHDQKRPIRVTAVWVNDKRTIVLVRLASLDKDAWLDATAYELPPDGLVWDRKASEWVTPAERAELRALMAHR